MPIRSRVFKRYVLSYLSVVLAVCMALGLALVRVASGQLRQAETEDAIRPVWPRLPIISSGSFFDNGRHPAGRENPVAVSALLSQPAEDQRI